MRSNSEAGGNTKERLSSIVRGFNDFDNEMHRATRQRREKEEVKIATLKAEIARLDGELSGEVKRRTEMNKSIQIWFEKELATTSSVLKALIEERRQATFDRIEEVNERIAALELKLEVEKAVVLQRIEDKGEELNALLMEFKQEFERDRALRIKRENHLEAQLSAHEIAVDADFRHAVEAREERASALRRLLERNVDLRDKANERFQLLFDKELADMRNRLQRECELRQREDDEIVDALNTYTAKLQHSLKVLNSSEI